MTRIEWLLINEKTPLESSDFYHLIDDFSAEFGEVSMETFKRYARKAMGEYNSKLEENTNTKTQFNSNDVLLDSLNETDNKLEIALKSFKIQDVEMAAKVANIDLSEWECIRKRVRASQNSINPWYIVEGTFKRKDVREISPEDLLSNFQKLLEEHASPNLEVPVVKHSKVDNIALLNFYDHHIGKRVHGDITGNGKEWTTQLAKESMVDATNYFINKVKDEVQEVWFILGNDLLNIDNPEGTTTKGTPQKNDIDYKHLILESEDLLITILEKLLGHFKVEVIVVPGNHDTNLVFLLGEILKKYFHNHSGINVDNSLPLLKYRQFGETAFGFVHGSEQIKKKYVLPMLMMQQRPDLASCKYHEFHTGHIHQTKNTQITEVMEEYGVLMRTLPTLSPTCEWANGKGFQGQQATECIVYNKKNGPIATYRYSE